MPCREKMFANFLDGIPDEKLKNFNETQYTIYKNYQIGYRLDHQGINSNQDEKPHIHRLYVQPLGGAKTKSKSRRRNMNGENSSVTARCHCTPTALPEEIREALMESFDKAGQEAGYAPQKDAAVMAAEIFD